MNKFAAETHKEFHDGLKKLTTANLLIVDLRGNPGGYLSAVIAMADEVLADKKLIVYTEGRNQPRNEYKAELSGLFEKGKVVVLIGTDKKNYEAIIFSVFQSIILQNLVVLYCVQDKWIMMVYQQCIVKSGGLRNKPKIHGKQED